jgi:hypothetical protein
LNALNNRQKRINYSPIVGIHADSGSGKGKQIGFPHGQAGYWPTSGPKQHRSALQTSFIATIQESRDIRGQ